MTRFIRVLKKDKKLTKGMSGQVKNLLSRMMLK